MTIEDRIDILLKKLDHQESQGHFKNVKVILEHLDVLLDELDGNEIKLKTSLLH